MTERKDKKRSGEPEVDTVALIRKVIAARNAETQAPAQKNRTRTALRRLTRREPEDGSEDPDQGGRRAVKAINATTPVVAAMLIVFFVPLWVLMALTIFAVLGTVTLYYAIGHDRICAMAVAHYRTVDARDPVKAENMRRTAARFSRRLSRLADSLPERWTRGLYIPDFEPEETHEKMANDPFERLDLNTQAN